MTCIDLRAREGGSDALVIMADRSHELGIHHLEWVTGIEPALSAWEVCGAAERPPAEWLTCGSTVPLTVRDRGCPPWFLPPGT